MLFASNQSAGFKLLAYNLRASFELGEKILGLTLLGAKRETAGAGLEAATYDGSYRSFDDELCRQEMLFLAKVIRASHWFDLLRQVEPSLRTEIDSFESATGRASHVLERLQLENPHLTADNSVLSELAGHDAEDDLPENLNLKSAVKQLRGKYLIGGEIDVAELMQKFSNILTYVEKRLPANERTAAA